jgi:hypothetical protein
MKAFDFQAVLSGTVQLEIEPAHLRQCRRAEKADEYFLDNRRMPCRVDLARASLPIWLDELTIP